MVETLVALAIISLLVGIGFASYRNFSRKQVLVQAARQLRSDLRLAANLALAGEKPGACANRTLAGYRIRFPNNLSYSIEAVCDPDTETVKSVTLPGDGTITFSPVPSPILFKVVAQGTDVSGSAYLTLTGFGDTDTVAVNEAGEVE